jgi:hypothetical protein
VLRLLLLRLLLRLLLLLLRLLLLLLHNRFFPVAHCRCGPLLHASGSPNKALASDEVAPGRI